VIQFKANFSKWINVNLEDAKHWLEYLRRTIPDAAHEDKDKYIQSRFRGVDIKDLERG
jgi:hypothetical protein